MKKSKMSKAFDWIKGLVKDYGFGVVLIWASLNLQMDEVTKWICLVAGIVLVSMKYVKN